MRTRCPLEGGGCKLCKCLEEGGKLACQNRANPVSLADANRKGGTRGDTFVLRWQRVHLAVIM